MAALVARFPATANLGVGPAVAAWLELVVGDAVPAIPLGFVQGLVGRIDQTRRRIVRLGHGRCDANAGGDDRAGTGGAMRHRQSFDAAADTLRHQLRTGKLGPGQDLKQNTHLASESERIEAELAGSGRILIRPSGTEPVVRVMVEARDARQARSSAERLAQAVRAG